MRPDTDLVVIVTDANGATKTLSSDAPDPGDRPRGIQFGSQLGSGFYVGSFNLSRAIDREHDDLHLGDDVRIMLANGDTVYEGWISSLPRSMDTEHSLTVNLSGYMALTADEPFTEIFVDRDLSRWTSAPLGRIVDLLAGNYTQPEGPSIAPDATTGRAAMILRTADEWASPIRPIAEAWLDTGSVGVGKIYWNMGNIGAASTADADWALLIRTANDDDGTSVVTSSADLWATLDTSGTFTDVGSRYAFISFFYNSTPAGGAGYVYSVHVRDLAVYGPHGLPDVGSAAPYGVAASDVIRYLIGRYCPQLNTAGVMDTTYPIGHLVFDESTVYDAMLKVNSFHLWDLACWEGKTIHFGQTDLTDYDYSIRHDDVGVVVGLQGDDFTDLVAGIQVKYPDVATGTQELLHPDDYAELRDQSIDNPANIHGRRKYPIFSIPFPTTAANALELGRIKLAELAQVKAPGTFTASARLRDRSGQWVSPSVVRSGQRIRLTSSAALSDRVRLIHEATYNHDSRSVTISVDSTRAVIEALLDRTTAALAAAGLGG